MFIIAKYDRECIGGIPTRSKDSSSKSPWNSIIKCVDWFFAHTKWKIKNEENTSFWYGSWTEISPLSLNKPRLYALSTLQHGSVKDFWNQSTND